jgi:hypothetical protein
MTQGWDGLNSAIENSDFDHHLTNLRFSAPTQLVQIGLQIVPPFVSMVIDPCDAGQVSPEGLQVLSSSTRLGCAARWY